MRKTSTEKSPKCGQCGSFAAFEPGTTVQQLISRFEIKEASADTIIPLILLANQGGVRYCSLHGFCAKDTVCPTPTEFKPREQVL